MSRQKLLFVLNNPEFFLSHRIGLARAAQNAGYQIEVAAPDSHLEAVQKIRDEGFAFHPIQLSRRGMRPWEELRSIFSLIQCFKENRPDLIHLLTIKPVLYGSLAAKFLGAKRVVATITGMGYIYTQQGLVAKAAQTLITLLYRAFVGNSHFQIIFQNPEDQRFFLKNKIITPDQTHLIPGSGVDIERFAPTPEPSGPPVILLPSRMLWDKGIREYVEAARILLKKGVHARFLLAGPLDAGNPAAIPAKDLEQWNAEGIVHWVGPQKDMPKLLKEVTIVCLPSYREGMPLALLEALSCQRAVVTADSIGCRDLINNMENGLIVPPRTSEPLADAIQTLLENAPLRARLAQTGRKQVEERYSKAKINKRTLEVYAKLT